MKRLLFTLFLSAAALLARADGKSLFITFSDGSRVEFALASRPTVTMADDLLTVSTHDTSASYELWRVLTFTFDDTSAAIRQAAAQSGLSLHGNQLFVPGAQAQVRVFAVDGRQLGVAPLRMGDYTVVDLNALPQGVYVISANGKTVKVSKR